MSMLELWVTINHIWDKMLQKEALFYFLSQANPTDLILYPCSCHAFQIIYFCICKIVTVWHLEMSKNQQLYVPHWLHSLAQNSASSSSDHVCPRGDERYCPPSSLALQPWPERCHHWNPQQKTGKQGNHSFVCSNAKNMIKSHLIMNTDISTRINMIMMIKHVKIEELGKYAFCSFCKYAFSAVCSSMSNGGVRCLTHNIYLSALSLCLYILINAQWEHVEMETKCVSCVSWIDRIMRLVNVPK